MSNTPSKPLPRTGALKNAQTRQRWELFHRAIEHAKQTNVTALESGADESPAGRPLPLDGPAA